MDQTTSQLIEKTTDRLINNENNCWLQPRWEQTAHIVDTWSFSCAKLAKSDQIQINNIC